MVFVPGSVPRVTRDRYDAFLVDLDGTLLDGQGTLDDGSRTAVARLLDAGYVVVIATGRSRAGTQEIHRALGLSTEACCYNGSWIGRFDGEPPFHYAPIPDDLVPGLLPLERRARHRFRHHGDHKYTSRCGDASHQRIARWFTKVVEVDEDGGGRLPDRDLVRVSAFFDDLGATEDAWGALPEDARRSLARETFPMAIFPGFEDVSLHLCEVQRKGRGKAEAYRLLADRYGVPASRVVAVGDQQNDLSLLGEAGLAVSMGNGVPALREVADLVIGDHREGGFARWIASELG
jgi:hydroxymethylpyrimidine pyrophosphatase-like HAD family hydrolase